MEPPPKPSTASLFQVYLRLKPPLAQVNTPAGLYPSLPQERFLLVEPPVNPVALDEINPEESFSTHITLSPPTETRRRAVEKFAFTRVFEEQASQLNVFEGTGVIPLVEGVLGADGNGGRDALLATLGVTGSGKTHTILGAKSQRGLTQLSLDILFRSVGNHILHPASTPSLFASLATSDASEAQILPVDIFLETMYNTGSNSSRANSRAPTPMMVCSNSNTVHSSSIGLYPSLVGLNAGSPRASHVNPPCFNHFHCQQVPSQDHSLSEKPNLSKRFLQQTKSSIAHNMSLLNNSQRITRSIAKLRFSPSKEGSSTPAPASSSRRNIMPHIANLPQVPELGNLSVEIDRTAEYAIIVSMYEVYNDRIFDLLTGQATSLANAGRINQKDLRRRPLLFKSTELSPDRKVVAGLRKIICGSLTEALMVLETGLLERRVAGTGSNSVSSRSHGFFCFEVKKRPRRTGGQWVGSTLTIVDLAGSERARDAKTAGATLAEAGKINESLMYLGQCLQMQSDSNESRKAAVVPFRQCKLTELLFSNSFPNANTTSTQHHNTHHHHHQTRPRNPQKAIMIVTADALGDFNATSQILRYSALAREVTVPRIPSVTSTILSGTTAHNKSNAAYSSGRTTPSLSSEELEYAAQEIARLTEELEIAQVCLVEERQRRREAEAAWKVAEEKLGFMEQEVREECWNETEQRIETERARWMATWSAEADRNDEHLDKKLEILTKTIEIQEDDTATEDIDCIEMLEGENEALLRRVHQLERELLGRSPTKAQQHREIPKVTMNPCSAIPKPTFTSLKTVTTPNDEDIENHLSADMKHLVLDDSVYESVCEIPLMAKESRTAEPKKVRKLTTRKWDLAPENELGSFVL